MSEVNAKYIDFVNDVIKEIECDLAPNVKLTLEQNDTLVNIEMNDGNGNTVTGTIGYDALLTLVKGMTILCNQINMIKK